MRSGRQRAGPGAKWAVASALLLVLTWSPLGRPEADRLAFAAALPGELDALAVQAGLQDEAGALRTSEPLVVEVAHEGGEGWTRDVLRDRVDAHPAFAVGASVHLLRAEVVTTPDATAFTLRLDRRGWTLRAPRAATIAVRPFVVASALLGALVTAWFTRRMALSLLVLGFVAQGMAVGTEPVFRMLPGKSLLEAWRSGGAPQAIARWAATLPEDAVMFGWILVGLCALGIALDHWRSRGRGGAMLTIAPLAIVGLGLFLDAAIRTHVCAYLMTIPGALIMISSFVAGLAALVLRSKTSGAFSRREKRSVRR